MTGDGAIIVPFERHHVEEAVRIFLDVFGSPPWNEWWSYDEARNRIEHLLTGEGARGWAVGDGELFGFALGGYVLGADGCGVALLVEEMAVRPHLQSRGFGTQLLRTVEAAALTEGVSDVEILTVAGKWPCHWYERHGYSLKARREGNGVILGRRVAR